MGAKKIKQHEHNIAIMRYVLIAIIIASSAILIWQVLKITGGFTAAGSDWENSVEVSADSSIPEVRTHLVFGNSKPASCADGVYIEGNGQPVSFRTENEIYQDGFCTEADVVFENVIYSPPQPEQTPQEPTPEESQPVTVTGASSQGSITYTIYYGKIISTAATEPEPAPPAPEQLPVSIPEIQYPVSIASTNVSNCTTISSPGAYVMNASITNSSAFVCMTISTSDVDFNCAGKLVDGTDSGISTGFDVSGSNVTIKNCDIRDWGLGVDLGSQNTLQNNVITSNVNDGVSLDDMNILLGNNISSNGGGISLSGPGDISNNITNNTINSNGGTGIDILDSNTNFIISNTISNNGGPGVDQQNASNTEVRNNVVNSNSGNGLEVTGPANNIKIINNTASSNSGFGLAAEFNNSNVTGNTFNSNSGGGISIDPSNSNVIINNIANSNNISGVTLDRSSHNVLTNNTANSNNGTGIRIISQASPFSRNNTLTNNTAISNRDYGMELDTTSNNTVSNQKISNSKGVLIKSSLGASSNNVFTSLNLTNVSRLWDDISTSNNSCTHCLFGSNNITFTETGVNITNTTSFPTDPGSYVNITHYLNITNTTAGASILLNWSYLDSQVSVRTTESTLRIAKNNGTWEVNASKFSASGSTGVDTVRNVVFANITRFGSVFAPLGVITNLTNCGNLTEPFLTYQLANNLSGVQTSRTMCIDVQASNLVLDCRGRTIDHNDAAGTQGILSTSQRNITIKNCKITDYDNGIRFTGTNNSFVINNTLTSDTDGISIASTDNNDIKNNTANSNTGVGILISSSNNQIVRNNTANQNTANGISLSQSDTSDINRNIADSNSQYGIALLGGSDNNTLTNNTANSNYIGIIISASSSNTLNNNTAKNNTNFDFLSQTSSVRDLVNTLDIGTTIVSFDSKDIALRKSSTTPTDPAGFHNIGKYVNATNNSADSFLFLNVSYIDPTDLGGLNESLLQMAKYNGTDWITNTSAFANTFGVNTAANYVFANITNFASVFAPLGNSTTITNCTNLTGPDTVYTLGNNLAGVQAGRDMCIDVQSDNVVLDCAGFSIDHNDTVGTRGIFAFSRTNVTIKNCVITDYGNGIDAFSLSTSLITNNQITSNRDGISGGGGGPENNIITNNNISSNTGTGINLGDVADNEVIRNNEVNFNGGEGIRVEGSNATIENNAVNSNNVTGIYVTLGAGILSNNTANSNTDTGIRVVTNSTLINNTANSNGQVGIRVTGNNNIFTNNAAKNNTVWDFFSAGSTTNNTAFNLDIGTTIISFESKGIALRNATSPAADPSGFQNISKYINATNNSATSFLFLNVSYTDSDLNGINESTLFIAKHNTTDWLTNTPVFANTFGVNTADNYVFANITNFASIFAPFGNLTNVDLLPIEMNLTPSSPFAGDNVTINVSVKNNGSTGSGAFNISFLDNDVEQSRQEVANLDFGQTNIYTFYWTAIFGQHNLTTAVDPDNVQNETNETNNNITTVVTIGTAPCNLTVLIDGVEASNFTNAGEPYNVTVNVTNTTGSPISATMHAIECNGLNQFALIQSIDSVVSNCDTGIVETGSDGIVSWTDVPTGGDDPSDSAGAYNVTINALQTGSVCDSKNFTVINRSPPPASGVKSSNVPNRANVEGTNERILVVFDRISRSRLSGAVAGETFDITLFDDGTSDGLPSSLTSGRPTGLNITVQYTNGTAIPDATIKAIEQSGLNHWALIQFSESNVSSEVVGTTTTDGNGNAPFTIVPTAGFVSSEVDAAIGAYSVTLQAFLPNGTIIFNNTITIDGTLPQPSPTEAVPNAGQVEGFNEKILILFDRISKFV